MEYLWLQSGIELIEVSSKLGNLCGPRGWNKTIDNWRNKYYLSSNKKLHYMQ